jgi:hypothetical protein
MCKWLVIERSRTYMDMKHKSFVVHIIPVRQHTLSEWRADKIQEAEEMELSSQLDNATEFPGPGHRKSRSWRLWGREGQWQGASGGPTQPLI